MKANVKCEQHCHSKGTVLERKRKTHELTFASGGLLMIKLPVYCTMLTNTMLEGDTFEFVTTKLSQSLAAVVAVCVVITPLSLFKVTPVFMFVDCVTVPPLLQYMPSVIWSNSPVKVAAVTNDPPLISDKVAFVSSFPFVLSSRVKSSAADFV